MDTKKPFNALAPNTWFHFAADDGLCQKMDARYYYSERTKQAHLMDFPRGQVYVIDDILQERKRKDADSAS